MSHRTKTNCLDARWSGLAAITVVFALLVLCATLPDSLWAQRNPPPVFESDYAIPTTQTPQPHMAIDVENGLAVVVYAAMLVVAVLAVHWWRSRRLLLALTVLSVGVLGFFLKGCPCPVGTLQSIVVAIISSSAAVPITLVVLFLLPLVAALFYGRVFCGSVCPIGAVQELVCLRPVLLPTWLDRTLALGRHVYLTVAVLLAASGMWFLICRTDPVVSLFRMSGVWDVLVFGAILLGIGVFIGRPYCRFFCPYGVVLGWCSRLASRRVSVTPGDCSRCRLCETSCPYQAILAPTAPPTREQRRRGPWRLLAAILVAPLLVGLFAFLGARLAEPLSRFHYDILLAERLLAERDGLVEPRGTFAETRAWMERHEDDQVAFDRAATTYRSLSWGTMIAGGWIGLVLAGHTVRLTVRRRREAYEVDPSRCVACGRCFWYCPNERGGRILLEEEES